MNSKVIVLHEEIQKWKDKLEAYQEQLAELIFQKDFLVFHVCKNIESKYLLKFGGLELKIYRLECGILRKKRKLELIQKQINRQESVNLESIEQSLEMEFLTYQKELEKMMENMEKAIERQNNKILSKEEAKEIKKIYYEIAKELHPDLHPNVSKQKIRLFQQAILCYKNADLLALQAIASILEKNESRKEEKPFQTMKKEVERLEKLIKEFQEKIAEIKEDYPYCVKDLLENAEKSEQYLLELQEQLKQMQDLDDEYKQMIVEKIRSLQ